MGALDKIMAGVTQAIKMNDHLESLKDKIDDLISRMKETEKDVRDIDKRLIRIETYAEIAGKQKLLAKDKK